MSEASRTLLALLHELAVLPVDSAKIVHCGLPPISYLRRDESANLCGVRPS